jgi:restriction system protein
MTFPKHNEIRVSALKLLAERGVLQLKEFETPLSQVFDLTEEEVERIYDSGNGKIFYDRISWALSYLNMAGLASKPKRGSYQITEKGKALLTNPEKIEPYVQQEMEQRRAAKEGVTIHSSLLIENSSDESTPSETINLSFNAIKSKIYSEIIDTIIGKKPREFEKIVVALLQKMGYGGEVSDSGVVTKQSNDEGIDGIIKEDVLGFGRIYIQAKRYAVDNRIGREDLNKFVGALAVAQSNKGVFITTSSFNNNAVDYANRLGNGTTLVLIDGEQLAKYIYEYSFGMQTEQIIEIKKLDSDFWDVLEDDD